MVGIWGMGGIGKTTLAKVVYNKLVDQYESCCFLNDIRETSQSKGLSSLQRKLASDILRREHEEFANISEGIAVLQSRLRGKKALILLDDVDNVSQLKALAGDLRWFCPQSRIIVTTREKIVLDQFQVGNTYQVELLDEHQALELFSKHAFGDALPTTDFVDLSLDIVEIAGKLPLALEVIGSSLFVHRGRRDIWESTIEQLRMEPNMKVKEKLKISYDSLDHKQKEIFLDIACFFTGTDVRDVIPTWDDCKFFPAVGIEILQLKSLIKILDGNKIWMHDQLIDLGRHIVDQENYKEPELRSRLWRSKEAIKVLADQQGTSKVEAMAIFQEESRFIVKGDCLRSEHFKKLSKLRCLQLVGVGLDGNFQHLLPELRLLRWSWCNVSLPAYLHRNNLVVLDLSCSWIDEDWNGWSSLKMVKLKVLKLSYCPELRRIPDFSAFPNLERLMLYFCLNLVSVDPSIGLLKALNILDMRKCQSLRKLPKQLGSLEALTELIIDGTFIQEIPISTGMKKLEFLSANQCKNLNRIPESVGSLMKLKRLSLEGCCGLKELPDSIGQLNSLVELRLGNSGITSLPRSLGTLEKLELLDTSCCSSQEGEIPTEVEMVARISRCARLGFGRVKILPEGISSLSRRRTHYRKGRLQTLPELPSSLISLKVEGSTRLAFPDLSALINLKELYLCGDFKLSGECLAKLFKLEKLVLKSVSIISLPEEIVDFSRLKEIDISHCTELKCLPVLPSSLCLLKIRLCSSLQKLPSLSNLKNLLELRIDCCAMVTEIDGLGDLVSLQVLCIHDFPELSKLKNLCKAIESIPDLSRLQRLKNLILEGCDNLRGLNGLGELGLLELLNMNGCKAIEKLPNLSRLQRLRVLRMEGCDKLRRLGGLQELKSLQILDISGCKAIEVLPTLSKLQMLRELRMEACEKLLRLEGLEELESLNVLDISGCRAIEKLPDLSKLQLLRSLSMGDCENIREVLGLDELSDLEGATQFDIFLKRRTYTVAPGSPMINLAESESAIVLARTYVPRSDLGSEDAVLRAMTTLLDSVWRSGEQR
ncbi:TMV resistance protein N-like [Punica granatum]|uniref:TMV resistance protein N-like n=1 Tax=Punica granatum TaxID=22663 RepID=A0A6P8C7V1_PUNGR|nr:TMV resistance protein N-like [Punica granatum]